MTRFTSGTLCVIEQAAYVYDEVVVAVVANPEKAAGVFKAQERVRLVAGATSHLPTLRSLHFHGLTVDLARGVGASVLVRAAHKERGNEFSMAATNFLVAGIPTVFVRSDPATPRSRPHLFANWSKWGTSVRRKNSSQPMSLSL